jgi:transcriptional regulator with XRE-family HTH domain
MTMVSRATPLKDAASLEETEGEDSLTLADAQSIGLRLRAVRRQMQLSLQAVEALSDRMFKSSVLGAYERGERNISVSRLKHLARLYDVPVDQLLPHDTASPEADAADGAVVDASRWARRVAGTDGESEKITIDLTKLDTVSGPERDPLRRFLSMIQVKRQDFKDQVITIRASDLHAIAYMFGVAPEALAQRLRKLGLLVQSGASSNPERGVA